MYLTLENELMPVAKEIKYITGVCCRAGSENVARLWQKIALKTPSAWSVWNPCLTVSITKAFMLLFLLEKDFIYFEINPRLPKRTVWSHCRGVRRTYVMQVVSQDSQGVRAWAAPAWRRSRGVSLIQPVLILPGLRMRRGYLASAVMLQYVAAASPQPRAMGAACLPHRRARCWAVPGTRDRGMGSMLKRCPARGMLRWGAAGLESDEGISASTRETQQDFILRGAQLVCTWETGL